MTLLRQELEPTGHDIELLPNRGDDHFSQKVRNLTGSHRTLEDKGLATSLDGRYSITDLGRKYFLENKSVSDAISVQGFGGEDREKIADDDFKDILIEEGAVTSVTKIVRERSSKLSAHARTHYSNDEGRVICMGCGFEGSKSYGEAGLGLIEMHHKKPLHLIEGEGEAQQLSDAVENIAPLCPNCHRLVHRKFDKLLSIEELQEITKFTP